jgi:hypothetical protein
MNILSEQSGHGDYGGLLWGIILSLLVAAIIIFGVSIGASLIVAKVFHWFGGSTRAAIEIGLIIGSVITALVFWHYWI